MTRRRPLALDLRAPVPFGTKPAGPALGVCPAGGCDNAVRIDRLPPVAALLHPSTTPSFHDGCREGAVGRQLVRLARPARTAGIVGDRHNRYLAVRPIRATRTTAVCGTACTRARGVDGSCSCNRELHGADHRREVLS